MVAYQQFLQDDEIPLLVFKDQDVRIQGAMSELIVNPFPLANQQAIVTAVKSWLLTGQRAHAVHFAVLAQVGRIE